MCKKRAWPPAIFCVFGITDTFVDLKYQIPFKHTHTILYLHGLHIVTNKLVSTCVKILTIKT